MSQQLKVALINHSDSNGGAAVVTYRLMHALRRAGVDARMVVFTKYTSDPAVMTVSTRLWRGVTFVLERLAIMFNNGFRRENLFKVSTATVGVDVSRNKFVREADVVVLSWVNQGLITPRAIRKLSQMGKPIVWTMHDMWCMTGICHHSLGCLNFFDSCGNCPFLGSASRPDDLSHRCWEMKNNLFENVPIHFIAVSNWLLGQAKSSSLLRDKTVEVIPNAFPIESFTTSLSEDDPDFLRVDGKRFILMGAARLDDPIKNLPDAIAALNLIFDEKPEVANNAEAIFFGDLRDQDALADLRFPHRYVGRIKDPAFLRKMFAAGSIVLSTSLFETLPGTLIEGQAAGCLPVTYGRGGQSDIVDHLRNGYIARFGDVADFANGIVWALNQEIDAGELHNEVGRKFSSGEIAARYIDLFNRLTGRNQ